MLKARWAEQMSAKYHCSLLLQPAPALTMQYMPSLHSFTPNWQWRPRTLGGHLQ